MWKRFGYIMLSIISTIYLLNPTAGVFELIPDVIPVIGNLDEVGAVLLLLKSLGELGIGPQRRRKTVENERPEPEPPK